MSEALLITGLHDVRCDRRGSEMLTRMSERASAQLRVLAHSRAEEVAFTRFLANRHFGAAELRASLTAATAAVCAGRAHVLVWKDTTEINFQHHAGRVRGLGPVGNGRDAGLFVHALLALDAADRSCLGLLDAQPWIRTPRRDDYRKRPIEQKESYRWLAGTALAGALAAQLITVIADRESDCFALFARRPHERLHLLIRASRDRCVTGGPCLFTALAALPESFCTTVAVPARPGMAARTAQLVVRFGALELQRPRGSREPVESVPVWGVEVVEIGATVADKQRIRWRLLTTHEVRDAAMAAQVIAWYGQRWQIEQLFRTVKGQGLDLEASQSEDAHALQKLAVMATHAATRILQLVQARDGAAALVAGEVFAPEELTVLRALLPGCEGQTARQQNPHPPDSLAWCAWIVARLGGWKGYRHSEGPPGPLTMRRGYERFCAIRDGYILATTAHQNVCKP
jgi:DDE family transposase